MHSARTPPTGTHHRHSPIIPKLDRMSVSNMWVALRYQLVLRQQFVSDPYALSLFLYQLVLRQQFVSDPYAHSLFLH